MDGNGTVTCDVSEVNYFQFHTFPYTSNLSAMSLVESGGNPGIHK
jgi:hypothetical protein